MTNFIWEYETHKSTLTRAHSIHHIHANVTWDYILISSAIWKFIQIIFEMTNSITTVCGFFPLLSLEHIVCMNIALWGTKYDDECNENSTNDWSLCSVFLLLIGIWVLFHANGIKHSNEFLIHSPNFSPFKIYFNSVSLIKWKRVKERRATKKRTKKWITLCQRTRLNLNSNERSGPNFVFNSI